MNINELNRINPINIEAAMNGVERGSGTFKEILDNVMDNIIVPLVDNSGMIVGMSFDTHAESIVQDCIEQMKFEMRYSCKPVMEWVLKSLELKADRKVISEVIENDEGIKVVTETGEVIEIETYAQTPVYNRVENALPSEVYIEEDTIENYSMDAVKKHLRKTYGHYLSGFDGDPTLELTDDGKLHVTNISWGRKI